MNFTQRKCCKYTDFDIGSVIFRVGIEHTQGDGPGAYVIATAPTSNLQTPKKTIPESSGDESGHAASDSDSSD